LKGVPNQASDIRPRDVRVAFQAGSPEFGSRKGEGSE